MRRLLLALVVAVSVAGTGAAVAPRGLAQSPATSWTTVAPMPTARTGLQAVEGSDGKIYAIGGETGPASSALSTVEAYAPSTNTWSTAAPLMTAQADFAAVVGSDGRIYAFGGHDRATDLNSAEAYSPATNTWAALAPMPDARSALSAALGPDGRIYVMGGTDFSGTNFSTIEAFDPATNSWSVVGSIPGGIVGDFSGPGGRIYAVVSSSPNGQEVDSLDAYNPSTNTWTTLTQIPGGFIGSTVAVGPDGQIYLLGGFDANGIHNTAEAYSPSTNAWSTLSPMVTAGYDAAAAAGGDGRIYIMGGYDGNDNVTDTVQAYTPAQPPTPTPRPTATPLPTATPTPTNTATATPVPLFARVRVAHKAVRSGGTQRIAVQTLPGASVSIAVAYPSGRKVRHDTTANSTGTVSWSFRQPGGVTRGTNRTVKVTVRVSQNSKSTVQAQATYQIR